MTKIAKKTFRVRIHAATPSHSYVYFDGGWEGTAIWQGDHGYLGDTRYDSLLDMQRAVSNSLTSQPTRAIRELAVDMGLVDCPATYTWLGKEYSCGWFVNANHMRDAGQCDACSRRDEYAAMAASKPRFGVYLTIDLEP